MPKKILLVEDEKDLSTVTQMRLNKSGYDATVVVDSKGVFAVLEKNRPDLILLDLLLPGMQGGDICKQLKADERYKSIPIILFTASSCDLEKYAKEIGADEYVLKPYDPTELLGKIKKLIGLQTG